MSFVLDALKRSEQDRHQGKVPSFSEQSSLMHLSKQKHPIWPYVLIGVLVLNAMVFLYIHFSSDDGLGPGSAVLQTEQPVQLENASQFRPQGVQSDDVVLQTNQYNPRQSISDAGTTLSPAALEPRLISKTDENSGTSQNLKRDVDAGQIDWAAKEAEAKRLIEESQLATEVQPSVPNLDDQAPVIIRPKKEPVGGALPFPSVASGTGVSGLAQDLGEEQGDRSQVPTDDYANVPYLYDIQGNARPRVPSLVFNSHIYSDSPSARRVMINNIYLREGQSLSGMEVMRIGESDIVFKKEGTLFRLPAMRDWNG